jgi:hypothetical protein
MTVTLLRNADNCASETASHRCGRLPFRDQNSGFRNKPQLPIDFPCHYEYCAPLISEEDRPVRPADSQFRLILPRCFPRSVKSVLRDTDSRTSLVLFGYWALSAS